MCPSAVIASHRTTLIQSLMNMRGLCSVYNHRHTNKANIDLKDFKDQEGLLSSTFLGEIQNWMLHTIIFLLKRGNACIHITHINRKYENPIKHWCSKFWTIREQSFCIFRCMLNRPLDLKNQ